MVIKILGKQYLEVQAEIANLKRRLNYLQKTPVMTEYVRLTEVDKTVKGSQNCICKGISLNTGKVEYIRAEQILAISGKREKGKG